MYDASKKSNQVDKSQSRSILTQNNANFICKYIQVKYYNNSNLSLTVISEQEWQ